MHPSPIITSYEKVNFSKIAYSSYKIEPSVGVSLASSRVKNLSILLKSRSFSTLGTNKGCAFF
jgi:hypothetical protein